MEIKTDRLLIRFIKESDHNAIRTIRQDFSLSNYAQYDKPSCLDEDFVRLRVAKWAAANEGREHMFFAVCKEDIVIGYIAFNKRDSGYETGYCFHSAYQGKGYAKESFSALIGYLRSLGITRLTAGTALANTPSVTFLNSLGFRQTGTEKVSFYKDANENDIIFDGGIFELDL